MISGIKAWQDASADTSTLVIYQVIEGSVVSSVTIALPLIAAQQPLLTLVAITVKVPALVWFPKLNAEPLPATVPAALVPSRFR